MDQALNYFRRKKLACWRIEKGGKRVDFYEGDNLTDAEEELEEALLLLAPGNYQLKVYAKKHGEAGQLEFDFKVDKSAKEKASESRGRGGYSQDEIAEARKQEREKIRNEYRLEELEKRIAALEKRFGIDDEEDNDEPQSPIDRVKEMASAMPEFMAALESMKSKK